MLTFIKSFYISIKFYPMKKYVLSTVLCVKKWKLKWENKISPILYESKNFFCE